MPGIKEPTFDEPIDAQQRKAILARVELTLRDATERLEQSAITGDDAEGVFSDLLSVIDFAHAEGVEIRLIDEVWSRVAAVGRLAAKITLDDMLHTIVRLRKSNQSGAVVECTQDALEMLENASSVLQPSEYDAYKKAIAQFIT